MEPQWHLEVTELLYLESELLIGKKECQVSLSESVSASCFSTICPMAGRLYLSHLLLFMSFYLSFPELYLSFN